MSNPAGPTAPPPPPVASPGYAPPMGPPITDAPRYLPPGGSPPRPRPGASLPPLSGLALVLIVLAGIAGNLALRTGVSTVSATVAVILSAIVLVRQRAERPTTMWVCAGVAVVFALALPVRASTWLAWLNSGACVAALVALALSGSGQHTSFSTSGLGLLIRRLFAGFAAPWFLGRSMRPARTGSFTRFVPIARGLLLAFVPILVLGSLLASADAVFAAAITPDIDTGNSVGHVLLTIICVLLVGGLVAIAETRIEDDTTVRRPLGSVEALVVLGCLALLFSGFAAVQLLSALGQTGDILATEGISAADYARNGFFQLLWVAALTGMLLAAVRLLVAGGSQAVNLGISWLRTVVALLTCVIVAVAIVRLGLYTDAFGQTTLRWYSTAFAWMLGVAFVLVAAAQIREAATWLPFSLVSLTAATLLLVNLLNPEARVAEHNLARSDAAVALDADYLLRLSADAWLTLLEHEDLVIGQASRRSSGFGDACDRADDSRGFGPFGFNLAELRLTC